MELKYPVMITLREIRDCEPCADGWKKVLAANGGANADLDAEFELSSIIDSNDLDDCLWLLRCRPEYQHLYRKLAVVFADEVRHLMDDERSLNTLDVAWSHSRGEATNDELAAALVAALGADSPAARAVTREAAWTAARDAAREAAYAAAWDAAQSATRYTDCGETRAAAWDAAWSETYGAALEHQSELLRHALTTGEITRKKDNQ